MKRCALLVFLLVGVAHAELRDPFVQKGLKTDSPPPVATPGPETPALHPGDASNQRPAKRPVVALAPEVSISGVLLSPTGNRAIVRTPERQLLVSEGQRVGDFRVGKIAQGVVVFHCGEQSFAIRQTKSTVSN